MSLAAVPDLAELAADPSRVAELPPGAAAALLATLAGLQSVLLARALAPAGDGNGEAAPDRLLTIPEAAKLLTVPPAFAYELARRREIPTVRLGRKYLRVPLRALQKILSQKSLDKNISFKYSVSRKRGRYGRSGVATDSAEARHDAEAVCRRTGLAPEQCRTGGTE